MKGSPDDQKSLNAIGEMSSKMPVPMAPDTSPQDNAREVIKGIASVPAPGKVMVAKIDPDVMGIDSCDRDYSIPCPSSFVPISGGTSMVCAPGRSYNGPCASESVAPAKMSKSAKTRWSKQCLAYWPCKDCKRTCLRAICYCH